MSWVQNKSRILSLGVAGALACGVIGAVPAAAEDALIVKSTVVDYKVGTKVKEADKITLEAGDVVTVLTRRGTRTMRGPGTFVVGANPKSNRARFADLTRQRAALRTVTGGVRSAGPDEETGRPVNPNLYYIDVERSGNVCLRDRSELLLWRPYNATSATYTLSETSDEAGAQILSLTIPFAERKSFTTVDGERFRVEDGASYTISNAQAASVTAITVIDLGADIKTADALAEALYQKGCMAQFELLTDRLASGS